ncbi:MAG: hypothetical protein U0401_21780 [Anaerolineae bacterium]
MPNYNQAQFPRHLEILVTNGKLAEVQAIIGPIGYDTAALEAGQTLLQSWLELANGAKVLLAAQMQATQNSQATCQAAQAELSQLGQTVRILFGADETVLTALGLRSRRRSAAGTTPDSEAAPDNHNNSYWSQGNLAEKIARWRRLLTNLPSLAAAQQGELAQFGWGAERLAAANALVEACAAAHTGQKQKIQAYRAAAAAAQTAEVTVREWYQQAARRTRLALQQVDPDNQAHLRGLLGL